LLHKALADAMRRELIIRNPCDLISPPKVTGKEAQILNGDQITSMLHVMRETSIYPEVIILLSTGMRRGELMGLQWGDVDLTAASSGSNDRLRRHAQVCASRHQRRLAGAA
jgi:integrase